MRFLKFLVFLLVFTLLVFHAFTYSLTECQSTEEVTVKQVKNASSQLNRSMVKVSGKVIFTLSTPALRIYWLKDATGKAITVKVPNAGSVPIKNSEVFLCAEVRELFDLNGVFKSVVLVELDRESPRPGKSPEKINTPSYNPFKPGNQ